LRAALRGDPRGLLFIAPGLAILDLEPQTAARPSSLLLDLDNDEEIGPAWLAPAWNSSGNAVAERIAFAMRPVRDRLLSDIVAAKDCPEVLAIMRVSTPVRVALLRMADPPLLSTRPVYPRHQKQLAEAFKALTQFDFAAHAEAMFREDHVWMPGLTTDRASQAAFIQVSMTELVIQARDRADTAPWLACINIATVGRTNLRWIFFPEFGGLWRRSAVSEDTVRKEMRALITCLATAGLPVFEWAREPKGPALLYWPRHRNHLGHMIWNSLSAVERLVDAGHGGPKPLMIYDAAVGLGANLYGRLSDIFPELSKNICSPKDFVARRPEELFSIAVRDGRQMVGFQAREVRTSLRGRLITSVQKKAQVTEVKEYDCPVVTFGLRLQDRTVPDLDQLYLELARKILENSTEESLKIVIDGMNASPDGDAFATNGVVASNTLMEREVAFVARFREGLDGLPITVESCVGYSMPNNILAMKESVMFVAPLGAGLVKYRWILNMPGFILVSAMNLKFSDAYDIYGASGGMEDPSPVLYNTSLQVEDLFPEGQAFDRQGKSIEAWKGKLSQVNFRAIEREAIVADIVNLYKAVRQGGNVV